MSVEGNDFADNRVAIIGRRASWEILVIRLGAFACVPQLLLGASLGYGLSFIDAVYATFLGSIVLQVLSFGLGVMGCREGLSTSLLARWSGFGRIGSALIGAVIAFALAGWFGVQNELFAQGLQRSTEILTVPVWALITGLAVTWVTVRGVRLMTVVASVALPGFLLVIAYAAFQLLKGHALADVLTAVPAGAALPLSSAITAVTGSFIIGAIVTPDVSRFMRAPRDVFWMTLISTFVGELCINLLAVSMALLLRTPDLITLMSSLTGGIGVAIVILSTIKLNNLNLYSSSLGLTTLVVSLVPNGNHSIRRILTRTRITWIVGLISTGLSMVGVITHLIGFFIFLGVTIPPIAGILLVDYFYLKRDRAVLAESLAEGRLPAHWEEVNPIALVAWIFGSAVGATVTTFGIPAINALIVTSVIYAVVMRVWGIRIGARYPEFRHAWKVAGES